jgi:hypothetical protein
MRQTASLISAINPVAVLSLGDTQYYCGSLLAFNSSYDLSWGQFKSLTHPAVGNHEYLTSGGLGCDVTNTGAAGYFTYFGAQAGLPSQGYYSYDLGAWHIVVLNSNCSQAADVTLLLSNISGLPKILRLILTYVRWHTIIFPFIHQEGAPMLTQNIVPTALRR